MTTFARGLAVIVVLALAGCAIAPMGAPVPSIDNVARARAAGLPPTALGSFVPAPGMNPALDQRISIRSNTIHSPYGSSFASYLKETFATDLRAAGLLDPQSPFVIAAQLTDSEIDVPAGPAEATIAARFKVSQGQSVVFERELRVRSSWSASFVGAEAVPMAINHYQSLYRRLVGTLLDDPGFRAALRRGAPDKQ